MATITICNCGTAYDENNHDLIANVFRKLSGTRYTHIFITAGPGSTEYSRHTYDPFKVIWPQGHYGWGGTATITALTSPWNTGVSYGSDKASGGGMFFNADQLMAYLKKHENTYRLPQKINFIGWSRGAVTSIIMANRINKKYGGRITLNIFGVDPVPGPGNFQPECTTVPGIVENYCEVLMEDEARGMMIAADVTSNATHSTTLTMPGVHTDGVEPKSGSMPQVAQIVAHLCATFLQRAGTTLDASSFQLTAVEILTKYAEIVIDAAKYLQDTNAVKGGWGGSYTSGDTPSARFVRRDVTVQRTGLITWVSSSKTENRYRILQRWFEQGNGYFVNAHHQCLFENKYPLVYHLANEGEKKLAYYNEHQLKSLFKRLDALPPKILESLENFASIHKNAVRQLTAMRRGYKLDQARRDTNLYL